MKQLKKQVLLALSMAACLFALTACSKAEERPSLGEMETALLLEDTKNIFDNLMTIQDEAMDDVIAQYRDNDMEPMAAGLEGYKAAKGDLGAFQSTADGTVEVSDDGYSITLNTVFEKRNCEFTITLDKKMSEITSMSFNPEYTTGENMTKAALNTLMGMGTVFLVLIFISWLISCFRYINQFENKSKKAPAPLPVITKAPVTQTPAAEENLTDDLELVAVITAAIASSTGASADGLVVRSIRRAAGSKWKKA